MGRYIPLSIPNFEGNERKYIDDEIDQGWVSTEEAALDVAWMEELPDFIRTIWGLINEQKPCEGEETYILEKAPYYADCILNIPSSTQITEGDMRYVAGGVKQLLGMMANG